MIIIKFLGLLALGMFLVCLVIAIKNAIDVEINKHFVIKNIKNELTKSLYLLTKANQEIKNNLKEIGIATNDLDKDIDEMLSYLDTIPRDEIEKEWNYISGGSYPIDLDEILDNKDDKNER